MTIDEYLYDTDETNRIRELAMGRLREPPAPFFSHQSLVLKVATTWSQHVESGQFVDHSRSHRDRRRRHPIGRTP